MTTSNVQGLPAPPSDGLAGEFFKWHSQGELRLLRCDGCETWIHPPQPTCGECGGERLEWMPALGTGAVFTWSVTHRVFHPEFEPDVPYVSAIVTLDEGPRLLTMLREVGLPDVVAGLLVRVSFEERVGGASVAVFVPVPSCEARDG